MKPTDLASWLDYQQRVHARGIDLGLERVSVVWKRLGAPRAPCVITVGGTNGKGSTVAFLEAMLQASGRRTGAYTSPHLIAYNERVRIDGHDAEDGDLCDAFARIEDARGELPLTYFEFGTLAALDLFARAGVEVALLEVGLGGRLDATNMVDADVAVVTTVDMDHMDWLGDSRDAIGAEKAGIARAGRPLLVGEADPPEGLLAAVTRIGADVSRAGIDFHAEAADDGRWLWRHRDGACISLPPPQLEAPCQRDNAAVAIAALHTLRGRLGWDPQALAEGVSAARVGGRLQRFGGRPELVVDVAHNPQAAGVLAAWLRQSPPAGRVHAVFGALADKDVGAVLAQLAAAVDCWYPAGLDEATPRGLPASALLPVLADVDAEAAGKGLDGYTDVAAALDAAAVHAGPDDRLLAFGSFFVAAAAIAWHRSRSQRVPPAAV